MRHRDKQRERGKENQRRQMASRLAGAMDYAPREAYLVFELSTHNPRTGARHRLEIKHEAYNGSNRYMVYLDGERWHKPWSRWGFCRWLFEKIDAVMADCY